jgi:hypothetical protein
MKRTHLASVIRMLPLFLAVGGSSCFAQERGTLRFTGLINDYTLADPNIKGSPYEMHGQWSMEVHESGKASFQADITMSDYGMTNGMLDATKGGQTPHTHHLRLDNATIDWSMTGCPAYLPPATTEGFQISGTVNVITGNGSNAPFETSPPTSKVQVCLTGGKEIVPSNMTLVFSGPASNHFGTQPIHGVVH